MEHGVKQKETEKMDTTTAIGGDNFVINRIESLRTLLPIIDLEKHIMKNK